MRKKFICALLVCFLLIQPAFAYVGIETNKDASLTVDHIHANVPFRIYRVTDVSRTVRFTLCGGFARYTDLQPLLDDWDWDALTDILDARVTRDKISSTASGKTDMNGKLTFDDLLPGLYLVMGRTYQKGDTTYYFRPSLVSVPNLLPDDTWDYNPVINPKYSSEAEPESPTPTKTSVSVQKIWQDAGFEKERPASITVQLLQDGTVIDTVTLSSANNWRWSWSSLVVGHQYHVVEIAVADGYSDRYSREGNTFVIINTLTEEPGPPTEPPKPTTPYDPDTDISDKDPPLEDPPLPETGQLWWPVPLLTVAGLLMILIGLIRRRGAFYEE